MKVNSLMLLAAVIQSSLTTFTASAHPSSGIVVDEQGDVFFSTLAHGVIYVAATGCRCVIKIMPDGHVETVLKAQTPWAPTGVALKGDDVWILEYTAINEEAHNYLPRVRKLGHDGKVRTLATFAPKER